MAKTEEEEQQQREEWQSKLVESQRLVEEAKKKKYPSQQERNRELNRLGEQVRRYKKYVEDPSKARADETAKKAKQRKKDKGDDTNMSEEENDQYDQSLEEDVEDAGEYDQPAGVDTPYTASRSLVPSHQQQGNMTAASDWMQKKEDALKRKHEQRKQTREALMANDQAYRKMCDQAVEDEDEYVDQCNQGLRGLGILPSDTSTDLARSLAYPSTTPRKPTVRAPPKTTGKVNKTSGTSLVKTTPSAKKQPARLAMTDPAGRKKGRGGASRILKSGVKSIKKRLSPSKNDGKSTLSFEERKEVGDRFNSLAYKMGAVPFEKEPKGSYQYLFDFSNIVGFVEKLLMDNPNSHVFLFKNRESVENCGGKCVQFDVFHALVVPKGERPPEWLDTKDEFVAFEDISIEWVNVSKVKDGTKKDRLLERWSNTLNDRVYVLVSKSRRWRNMSDEQKKMFMEVCLLDSRRGKFPQPGDEGGEFVKDAYFSCEIQGVKVESKHSHVEKIKESAEFVVDEFEDDHNLEVGADGKAYIVQRIREAIQERKEKLQKVVEDIHYRHDMDKVDEIFVAKIYPANVNEAIPMAARIEHDIYSDRMVPMNAAGQQAIEDEEASLELAINQFRFKGCTTCVAFGPARTLYAGTDFVDEEDADEENTSVTGI